MNQDQQQDKMFNPKPKDAFNFLVALAGAHATTITPFIRKGFGPRGKREGLGLILLGLVVGFSGQSILFIYLLVWVCFVVLRRAEAASMRRNGWEVHSEYTGWPELGLRVGRIFGVRTEKTAKMVVEPLICLAIGIMFGVMAEDMPWLYPLAGWIGIGAISIAFDHGVSEALIDRRVDIMRDAKREQEIITERYRERYGE